MTSEIQVPKPLINFIHGSSLGQEPDRLDLHGYGEAGRNLWTEISAAGSARHPCCLGEAEIRILREFAELCLDCTSDEPSLYGGERRAARRVLEQIDR